MDEVPGTVQDDCRYVCDVMEFIKVRLFPGIACRVAKLQVPPMARHTLVQLVDVELLNTHRITALDGLLDGTGVGGIEGIELGLTDGFNEGDADGLIVLTADGCTLGDKVGEAVGNRVGAHTPAELEHAQNLYASLFADDEQ